MEQLPITKYEKEILEAVRDNRTVIITADTGAGKSTQVPQYLLRAGYNLVVTQPRRLAARTVAQRIAFEMGEELGKTIGVRTRDDKVDSAATRCLLATDGLALVRELMGVGKHNLLVLDEVHEWNKNIETLVAWVKLQLCRGADFKVVLMSATLEAQKLSEFFDNAPVIEVPGRLFPIEERMPGRNIVEDTAKLLHEGHNVLVFQPGKTEIAETIKDLKALNLHAEILPLHGELTPEEQAACFKHYGRPKCVVATNVAQTSITIDDIDAVVDSGMERRTELVDGVEGLYLLPISYADGKQRKGRAGRTKPGIYIDHCASAQRLDFPKAEILRSRLDQTVLRLAEAGFDAEELSFFHQPPKSEIHEAKRALHALGCMDGQGQVTPMGRQISRLPISVKFGRMLVEADRLGVVDDVLTIAAILEVGEITLRKDKERNSICHLWQRLCAGETSSDVMAQLAVYNAASKMTKEEMAKNAISIKAYFQAKEVRRHLAEALRGKVRNFKSTGKREDILRAVCAGMVDHLYRRRGFGQYESGENSTTRELTQESVVHSGEWVVGMPFDLQVKGKYGSRMLYLIRMVTRVDPAVLAEVAPQLTQREVGINPYFDPEMDSVVSITRVRFNGQPLPDQIVADPKHPQATEVFANWLARKMVG